MTKLTFDNNRKPRYMYGTEPVPSVTEILGSCGFFNFSNQVNNDAMIRGTRVHMLCQYMDEGDYASEQAERFGLVGYVQAWDAFCKSVKIANRKDCIEIPKYHPLLKYAGTPDRVWTVNDYPTILDIKTGQKSAWHEIQSSAYQQFPGLETCKRWAVYLANDGTFKVEPHNEITDRTIWFNALNIYSWKLNKGIIKND